MMDLRTLLASTEFWAALAGAFAGAITAFALGTMAQWRGSTNAKRSAGNSAIMALAEMYSEAKAIYDSIFVRQRAELLKLLGREPLFYEYKAVMDMPKEPPALDVDRLAFLADSHDPDILVRIVTAKNYFAGMLKVAAAHERLCIELQRRLAKAEPTAQRPMTQQQLREAAGMDVMLQLKSTVENMQVMLTELTVWLLRLTDELRDVLLYHFPSRSFVRFIPQDRGKPSEARSYAMKPARWRRIVRYLRRNYDRAFGPRWPS